MSAVIKQTKIICTIGPSSHTEDRLFELAEAGMDVCRLNFSHGTHEDHAELIQKIRRVSERIGRPLAILQDLQGPKIRVGELPAEGVTLVAGERIIFTTGAADVPKKLPVTYAALHQDVKPGQRILLDDGIMSVKVVQVDGQDVMCEVIYGGTLTSHKGMNLPDTKTSISALSDKDREDVRFGVAQGVDWVALSFVRSAQDLQELRGLIRETEKEQDIQTTNLILLMAKIEKPEAVQQFDEILQAADGIMVARGDLGIEIPAERVPIVQKDIIKKCLSVGKPVVVATQMLDSMIRQPRATRAEVSDIANAVIDHADATMLSGETASGAYPVEAVQTMAQTIHETEASTYDDLPIHLGSKQDGSEEAMTNVAAVLAESAHAKAVLVASLSGHAARLVSRYRPAVPIFAVTPSDRVVRQLTLSWGIQPWLLPQASSLSDLLRTAADQLVEAGSLQRGDDIVVVAGEPLGQSGHVNLVELRKV